MSKIDTITTQLNELGTIPSKYRADAADRLRLTFDPPQRPPRQGGREEAKYSTRRWKEKKAYHVYSDILDHRPDVYLAFILAVPPKACTAFEVVSFLKQLDEARQNPLSLKNEARSLLQNLALKGHFESSERFKTYLSTLFPLSSCTCYNVAGANKGRTETCECGRE